MVEVLPGQTMYQFLSLGKFDIHVHRTLPVVQVIEVRQSIGLVGLLFDLLQPRLDVLPLPFLQDHHDHHDYQLGQVDVTNTKSQCDTFVGSVVAASVRE